MTDINIKMEVQKYAVHTIRTYQKKSTEYR